jgi:hypothetical protein
MHCIVSAPRLYCREMRLAGFETHVETLNRVG